MKRSLALLILAFCTASVAAQGPNPKLISDIKKLSGEYLTDFKNIRGGIKSDDDYETVFYSRLVLTGSVDSSSLVHYIKESQQWSFTADINKQQLSAAELRTAAEATVFSFGKLRRIASGVDWVADYIPANKKGLLDKQRCFLIRVFDFMGNPNDQTGGKLQFLLGREDNYMNK